MPEPIKKEDVKDVVDPTNPDSKKVEEEKGGDDKSNNLAALRKKNKELEDENARLKAGEGDKKDSSRSLLTEDEEDEEDSKSKKLDPIKVVFQRDVKEATHQWNKKNKVSSEEWQQIQKKVSLTGEETLSEISDKIDEAYNSLPSVRERRDKELIEKGKKIAMTQFQDEELDSFGGGDSGNSQGETPKGTAKERKFLSSFGVTPEEQKKIDRSANPNEWTPGPSPVRKFFDGAKR